MASRISPKVLAVANGLVQLSSDEIRQYNDLVTSRSLDEVKRLVEEEAANQGIKRVEKALGEKYSMTLGPIPTGCPCCGRG